MTYVPIGRLQHVGQLTVATHGARRGMNDSVGNAERPGNVGTVARSSGWSGYSVVLQLFFSCSSVVQVFGCSSVVEAAPLRQWAARRTAMRDPVSEVGR